MTMAALAAIVIFVAVVVGALTWHHHDVDAALPKVFYPEDASFGIAVPYAGEAAWSFGAVPLCLTRPGTVTITGVTPVGSNGQITPVAFSTRTMPQKGLGDAQESLQELGFPRTAVVTAVCDQGAPSELGTTFRFAPGPKPSGRFTALRVAYTSKGRQLSTVIPWTLKLCGPGLTTNETCGAAGTP